MSAAAVLSTTDAVEVASAPVTMADGAPVVMAMPTVTYGAPVATAAPFLSPPIVYSAPQAVFAQPGQVTYMGAPSADGGQIMYLSPATAEIGQAMYTAPWTAAEAGQVMYLPPGAEAAQVAGAEEGQELTFDASGVAVTESGQIASLVPTILEGSPVPTYASPCAPVGYMEAAAGQQTYAAPMAARVNVSHEIFAKLAAGVQLTPEEMRALSGQPAADEHPTATVPPPEQPVELKETAAVPVGIESGTAEVMEVAAADAAAANTSAEAKKTDPKKKSDAKKALKASKKKKEKGCC